MAGYLPSIEGLPAVTPTVVSPAELESTDCVLLLDVRGKGEHADGHIPGSQQLNAGRVPWNQDSLPREGTIVTYCQTGVRNSVAASALRRAGFTVAELDGSYAGWSRWHREQGHDAGRSPAASGVA